MSMLRFYYAHEDEYGVLCVDRLENSFATDEQKVRDLAEMYPDMLYFGYWPGDPEMRPVSGNAAEADCDRGLAVREGNVVVRHIESEDGR